MDGTIDIVLHVNMRLVAEETVEVLCAHLERRPLKAPRAPDRGDHAGEHPRGDLRLEVSRRYRSSNLSGRGGGPGRPVRTAPAMQPTTLSAMCGNDPAITRSAGYPHAQRTASLSGLRAWQI